MIQPDVLETIEIKNDVFGGIIVNSAYLEAKGVVEARAIGLWLNVFHWGSMMDYGEAGWDKGVYLVRWHSRWRHTSAD